MKKVVIAFALLLAGTLLFSTRWATTAVEQAPSDTLQVSAETSLAIALSIKDMTEQSDVIAIGHCVETKSVWIERSLVTMVTVEVAENLKGTDAGPLTVVLPGGVDANRKFPVAMTYPGAPQIRPGEDVFLFLNANPDFDGGYTVAGFSQGKFSIVTDEDGEQMVSRDLTKTILKSNNGVRRGSANATPLSTLKAEVKRYLQQQ